MPHLTVIPTKNTAKEQYFTTELLVYLCKSSIEYTFLANLKISSGLVHTQIYFIIRYIYNTNTKSQKQVLFLPGLKTSLVFISGFKNEFF